MANNEFIVVYREYDYLKKTVPLNPFRFFSPFTGLDLSKTEKNMSIRTITTRMSMLLLCTLAVPSVAHQMQKVNVEIIDEHGVALPVYETDLKQDGRTHRRYLEATRGKNYAIRIRNNSNSRVGLVIAVDGRNIISGEKSQLGNTERMYILGPWQSASYEGWRASREQVNKFYFTEAEDSYAGAWKDYSAMGVIALAVFEEKNWRRPLPQTYSSNDQAANESVGENARMDEGTLAGKIRKKESAQPGTGYGEKKYSRARLVHFSPKAQPAEEHFLKYEWRSTLCQVGVLQCLEPAPNRFWPEKPSREGFVPPPSVIGLKR